MNMIKIMKNNISPEKKIQIINVLLNFLISFYLILHIISHLFKVHRFKTITGFILLITTSFIILFINKRQRKYFFLTMLYVVILVIWSSFTQQNNILTNKWNYTILIMLAAGFMIANKILNSLTSRIIFIIVLIVFIYCYFIQTNVEISGDYIFRMNRNFLSSYLITLSSLIYITDYLENKRKIVIWPASITLFLSIYSQSRTGTAIATMFFISVFIVFYKNHFKKYFVKKIYKNNVLKLFLFFILVSIIILICLLAYKYSRFATEGVMNNSTMERLGIYKNFFKELTFGKALTGFKSEYLTIRYDSKLSMHNTFLQLWSYVGIAALPAFAAIAWMIHYYYRKAKLLMIILLLFCLYSLPEWVFFFRYPDLIFFSLFFIALNKTLDQKTNSLQ